MPDTQGITYSELMQSPTIMRVVNRIQTPLSLFQGFFGRMSGDNSSASDSVRGRNGGWDIMDVTRQISGARSPGTPPRRVAKKKIGHVAAQLMRSHESIIIFDEEVFKARPLGGNIGSTVDMRGQNYIQRQIQYMTQKYRNQREWMYSRMLRGGFNMERDGDNYTLKDYNANATDEIVINYQIPAEHQSRLDMGTGSNILTDWGVPTADVMGQCFKINEAMTRIHGRALKHVWIDTNTFINLQNNTALQAIGGTAYKTFDFMSRREGRSKEGIQDAGFDVEFRAMPLWRFHVYDGVLATNEDDGTSTSDTAKLVPTDYAIFLPDPDGDWEGLVDGSELVRENEWVAPIEVQGFHSWATPIIDPPGQELKFLDNYLPVLYNPRCVAYGYVGS